MSKRLKAGDEVRIRNARNGDWCLGVVILASNAAVAFELDGTVWSGNGLIAGVLPVFIDYERETVTGIFGDEYEIEVKEG